VVTTHVDDAAERSQRQIGRPSTVANFRKHVVGILQETPDLASLEILRRVREAGYQGGKTALYALVASLRPKPAKPLGSFRRSSLESSGSTNGNDRFCENGHANVFRYQVNRLLGCMNVVRVFRSDSLASRCLHDCVMNNWVNSSSKQNPVILCEILERDVFLLSSRVGLRECSIIL
jgi:hypothetical protein